MVTFMVAILAASLSEVNSASAWINQADAVAKAVR
jgi:hypothetical protein